MHTRAHTRAHTHVYTHTHTHARTHTHTHTHTDQIPDTYHTKFLFSSFSKINFYISNAHAHAHGEKYTNQRGLEIHKRFRFAKTQYYLM